MQNTLLVKIRDIIHKPVGSRDEDTFLLENEDPLLDDDEFRLAPPISGHIAILKPDEETFQVICSQINGGLWLVCDLCGDEFLYQMQDVRFSERDFYTVLPEQFQREQEQDVFLVDAAEKALDLREMFRQELLLALPLARICENCKKKRKNVLPNEDDGDKSFPFAGLKNLLDR